MHYHDAHAGPPPTLADRLGHLNDNLCSLASRLKDAIAAAVGNAVSQAIRDLVRALLGQKDSRQEDDDHCRDRIEFERRRADRDGFGPDRPYWGEDEDPWQQDGLATPLPPVRACTTEPARRWPDALRAAVQAGLWWLRTRPLRRPLLTAALVALAAGGTAVAVGPAAAACLSVAASAAGLLLTADSARSVADLLGALAG